MQFFRFNVTISYQINHKFNRICRFACSVMFRMSELKRHKITLLPIARIWRMTIKRWHSHKARDGEKDSYDITVIAFLSHSYKFPAHFYMRSHTRRCTRANCYKQRGKVLLVPHGVNKIFLYDWRGKVIAIIFLLFC